MGNTRKMAWQGIFKTLLLFAMLTSGTLGYSFSPKPENHVMGAAPINLEISGRSSGSISFTWDGVDNPDNFKVWYYRSQDNYTSAPVTTANEYITYSSLPSGTYVFYFVAIHGQETSSVVATADLIM